MPSRHLAPTTASNANDAHVGPVARIALALTSWTERWVPDAFIFALLATLLVVVAGVTATSSSIGQVVDAWGGGFWELIPFTLQMALIIITGHVLATSQPARRVIKTVAGWPTSPRAAVALVAVFAMVSSWFNWGFSLVFSAVLAREVARRVEGVDYRALAAASFLGLGSIWAQGLSGSAALQMASAGALQPRIRDIVANGGVIEGGIITFRHTIFLWQSLVSVAVEIGVVGLVMFFALGAAYLVRYFMAAREPLNALNLNILNLGFLLAGMLLHRTPARLMRAVQAATPAVWGVILQFPFYAGIAGVITATHLNDKLANLFVSVSTPATFPPLVAIYSAVLGVFVPSGGSKWVIEAPYVMAAAHSLQVHLGWVVAAYDLGEALANLIQPFWMLPMLGMFGLRARDVMGYTFLVFLVLTPVVLLLVTLLGLTLSYPL